MDSNELDNESWLLTQTIKSDDDDDDDDDDDGDLLLLIGDVVRVLCISLLVGCVAQLVFDRRTFPALRSTCSW